jgi:hypothetical protein
MTKKYYIPYKTLWILIIFFSLISSVNQAIVSHHNEVAVNISWIQTIGEKGIYNNGFNVTSNYATRGMEVYNDELYIGTQNVKFSRVGSLNLKLISTLAILVYKGLEYLGRTQPLLKLANIIIPLHGFMGDGCEVWKYNNSKDMWIPIISNSPGNILSAGFGTKKNFAAAIIREFKGDLYIGTATNSLYGCEVYRYNQSGLECVSDKGFGDRFNSGAWSVSVYNNELYIGTMNWNTGCQIWKSRDGKTWVKLDLPNGDGFGSAWNVYAWSMGVYNNSLYIGTCNLNPKSGCQLWKLKGENWSRVQLPGGDGFGDKNNYGIRNIVEYNSELYVSTASNFLYPEASCDIWKYDGETWENLIKNELGDPYNKYIWTMIVTSDNKLWVGTLNLQTFIDGVPFNSHGCEIWTYDGELWKNIVGDNGNTEISGGFGNKNNIGARSMIEYPKNSKIIWVGTWNTDILNFKDFRGCEIWKRSRSNDQNP